MLLSQQPKRDPKRDPVPGDAFRKNATIRTVIAVHPPSMVQVSDRRTRAVETDPARHYYPSLKMFRRWAEDAVLVKRGDQE